MCFVFADSVALLEGLKTSTFGQGFDDQQYFCRQHLTMSTMSDFDRTAYMRSVETFFERINAIGEALTIR